MIPSRFLCVGAVAALSFLAPASKVLAAETDTGRIEHTVQETVTLDYLITLPDGYEADGEAVPLLVFLHGAGERGDNVNDVKRHGPHKLIEKGESFPAIVVSPQCPAGKWWSGVQLRAVLALIDDLQATHAIDPDRIYLTGLSMGGYGTWELAGMAPDRFAAIVPICGGGTRHAARTIARNRIPVWAFHGTDDSIVAVEETKFVFDWIRREGVGEDLARLTLYPGVDHDSWTRTYDNPEVWTWLFSQKRTPRAD